MKKLIVTLAALAISTACGHGAPPRAAQTWDFSKPGRMPAAAFGCTLTNLAGVLHGVIPTKPPAVYFIMETQPLRGPARLVMRVRTCTNVYGRGELYWSTRERPRMGMERFIRFPLRHDGAWQDITVNIPERGTLQQVRICPGWTQGTFDVAWLRLEPATYPAAVTAGARRLPASLVLEDAQLRVELQARRHRYLVQDRRTGRTWSADGAAGKAKLYGARQISARVLELDLYDFVADTTGTCRVTLAADAALAFDLACADPSAALYALNNYPPAFTAALQQGKLLFCDRSSGTYIDQTDTTYGGQALGIWGNTQTANMPWVGVVDETRGDGVITLVDTPTDALMHLLPDAAGRHWPQIYWEEARLCFGYARRLRLLFTATGGYVGMAARYRTEAAAAGRVVPLAEKVRKKPAVRLLPGAVIVWGASDALQFVREARTEGMLRAAICNAHHGLRTPASLEQVRALGYLTLEYENVQDVMEGATAGKNTDSIAEVGARVLPGLPAMTGWSDPLVTRYVRASSFGLRAITNYLPERLQAYGFNGLFLDVSMADNLRAHYGQRPYDNRADLAYRREIYEYFNRLGLVVGTEHGNDWGCDLVDWTEGALGGPFHWLQDVSGGWSTPQIRRAAARTDYTQQWLRYGNAYDTKIPLWQLVYHDCVVSTWYWSDTPGMHYWAAPEISERKDLFAILYAGVPLLWRDNRDYDWNVHRERWMRSYHEACPLAAQLAFSRMTQHAFVTRDCAVQRTLFDNGTEIVVNFGETAQAWQTSATAAVTLAPRGYLARGPGIWQSRLLEGGAEVARAELDGYWRYETATPRAFAPGNVRGRLIAFRVAPDRWQVALGTDSVCRVNVAALTGWAQDEVVTVAALDSMGETRRVSAAGTAATPLQLDARRDGRFHALMRGVPAPQVVLYPAGGRVAEGTPVLASCAVSGSVLRYTVDGTSPGANAPAVMNGTLAISTATTVTVAAFLGDRALAPAQVIRYVPYRQLLATGLLRGRTPARAVRLDVTGLAALRVVVGQGGDHPFNDWATLGEPVVRLADGRAVPLAACTRLRTWQSDNRWAFDQHPEAGSKPAIAERTFSTGLVLQAEADFIFVLPAGAAWFETWVGVDDGTIQAPQTPADLLGALTITFEGTRGLPDAREDFLRYGMAP